MYVVFAVFGVKNMVNCHCPVIICTNCLYTFSSCGGNKTVAYRKSKGLVSVPVFHSLTCTGFLVQRVKMKEIMSGLRQGHKE